ncbi:sorting nexin-17-like [Dendronephthya gigantea]|uniref:sorting nexin-17-like n=1 Tax=Dendronephthya gigantea TaxID=151771 RepID=UPI001069E209|nr:sorting nexin-17-like [Dendronephthya gigantea]
MHFAILEIEEKTDEHGSYVSYAVSINGGFHSSIRYRQLRELHDQLKKDFGARVPDRFPPKKLLTLNQTQLEDRREQLEKYLQAISQDPVLVASKTFLKFLLKAQKESSNVEEEDTELDIYLMNGKKFQVKIRNTDSTDHVIQEAMSQIKLPQNMVQYFSLFLIEQEEESDWAVIRKLQGFESPSLVLMPIKETHRLVIRKNFWDLSKEDELYKDKIALNLLFVQAVNDVERDWVITTPETLEELGNLKTKNERKKYLKLARSQKFYGYLQLKPCKMDFPHMNSHVILNVGGYELNFRLIGTQDTKAKEGCFKVTRMKCWRVVSSKDNKKGEIVTKIAFEYLFSKEKLQWVTIISEQAMLVSLCLQGMVDEIVERKAKAKKSEALKQTKKETETAVAKESSAAKESAAAKELSQKEEKQEAQSSDEGPKDGNEDSPSTRGSKKKKQKKIVSVKNEIFAQDIKDEDL